MTNNRSDENTDKLTEEDFSLSDKLTLQEQKVIPSRRESDGEKPHTIEGVRSIRERIRQIEAKAGGRCRRELRDYLGPLSETEYENEQRGDYDDGS